MVISLKTQKALWGHAASRCAFPDCREELVKSAGDSDDRSLVGEACHIVARQTNGARGDSSLTPEERDTYGNLILLCNMHHKMIDDAPSTYTVESLQAMKSEHERWVRESLVVFDARKQLDDETYAGYAEEWANRAGNDNWPEWTSRVLSSGHPSLRVVDHERLEDLRLWLHSRVWPHRYAELESAFQNFLYVLDDFLAVFLERAELDHGGDLFRTVKFYHIDWWDPVLYGELARQYGFHVDLVEDLTLELTRAANYVCDQVRRFIDPTFGLQAGALLVESGPYPPDFSWRRHRVEYRDRERVEHPYPGIEEFKTVRESRDFHFGEGNEVPSSS